MRPAATRHKPHIPSRNAHARSTARPAGPRLGDIDDTLGCKLDEHRRTRFSGQEGVRIAADARRMIPHTLLQHACHRRFGRARGQHLRGNRSHNRAQAGVRAELAAKCPPDLARQPASAPNGDHRREIIVGVSLAVHVDSDCASRRRSVRRSVRRSDHRDDQSGLRRTGG